MSLSPGFIAVLLATSAQREVLHCKGDPASLIADAANRTNGAPSYVWYYALWSLIQQSEIQFACDSCRPHGNAGESLPVDQKSNISEQLPMHEFLARIRAQLLWGVGAP